MSVAGRTTLEPDVTQGAEPRTETPATTLKGALSDAATDQGTSLLDLTRAEPTLIVFLRHAGCTFCREALADLAATRAAARAEGRTPTPLVLVHMGRPASGRALADRYGLDDVPLVSDPDRALYRAFELGRGSLGQLFGPRVWWRGFVATLRGHFIGLPAGDGLQMPGAFLVSGDRIVRAHRHRDAADRPDYVGLCELPTDPAAEASTA